jgi:hypothetical protein
MNRGTRALATLINYLGIVCSGGTISVLSYIAATKEQGISTLAIISFISFVLSLLSLAIFLNLHFVIHSKRREHFADVAQKFFMREKTLEEVMQAYGEIRTTWLYRLLFWIPFLFAATGFTFGALAALN